MEGYGMAKEKVELYEEIVFDDVQYAVDTYNMCKRKLKKVENGLIFAVVATGCNLFAWIPMLQGKEETIIIDICMLIGIVCTFIAYIKGGGILSVFRWAWKIGKFVWFILVFPFDIFGAVLAWYCSLVGFLFVPLIFVFINYRQIKMNYQAASKYISYYKTKAKAIQPTTQIRNTSNQTDRAYGNVVRNQTGTSSGYNRAGTSAGTGRTYGSATRSQDGTSLGYSRVGTNVGTGRTYGSTTRNQSGTSSSYNRTGGYSGTRNYR